MSGPNGPQDVDAEEVIMPAGDPPHVLTMPEVERRAGEAEARFNEGGAGRTPALEGDIPEATFEIMMAFREQALTKRLRPENEALIVKIEAKLAADAAAEEAEATNGDK